jgi:hypothetical protein
MGIHVYPWEFMGYFGFRVYTIAILLPQVKPTLSSRGWETVTLTSRARDNVPTAVGKSSKARPFMGREKLSLFGLLSSNVVR